MYTQLSLVNACLRAIGNEQVGNLDFPDVDTDIAITTVDEARVEVLSQGWWFNIEENWKLSPNDDGEIAVPGGVLEFRTARISRQIELVKRDGKFYNKTDHTFDMTDLVQQDGSIDFDFIIDVIIDDCPVVSQQYIRQRARTQFMSDLEADANKIEKSSQEELRFLALLERQQHRNSKHNVYGHSRVQQVLGGMVSVNSFVGSSEILNPLGGRE